tara:strand:+ start:652 stop:909 length:258 start_codon:yes stop_codon:yes gene_type:complete
MDGVKADKAAKKLFEDPAYNCEQIIKTMSSLKQDTEKIFNLPPPKPKTPEKLLEDKGDDFVDTMKDAFKKDDDGSKADKPADAEM